MNKSKLVWGLAGLLAFAGFASLAACGVEDTSQQEDVAEAEEAVGEGETCGVFPFGPYCDSGLSCCAGAPARCRNLDADNANCGSCGHACQIFTHCSAGHCCQGTKIWCGNDCYDTCPPP